MAVVKGRYLNKNGKLKAFLSAISMGNQIIEMCQFGAYKNHHQLQLDELKFVFSAAQ